MSLCYGEETGDLKTRPRAGLERPEAGGGVGEGGASAVLRVRAGSRLQRPPGVQMTWRARAAEESQVESESALLAMKNLLLGLLRKMRLSQKTVFLMYQAMNMPENFWLMRQLKDFGCHWGKKSKLCSVGDANGMVTERVTKNALFLSKATRS
ncbi:retinitis pigmentosa 9 protein isoform X2 [Marmota marmota marmota]|uniref:retinitis pigmentosa 9 protein isoform X2 n=1 Tax=Marmota marmota marmota TaxID=9994 RepID=UPI00209354C7|nr:retinitis pigmentosa 9 protein isoform X2 [Marmota marmota marmota]